MSAYSNLWEAVMGGMRVSEVDLADICDAVDAAIGQGLGHWILVPSTDPTNHDAAGSEKFGSEGDAIDASRYLDPDVVWEAVFCPADRTYTIRKLENMREREIARENARFSERYHFACEIPD